MAGKSHTSSKKYVDNAYVLFRLALHPECKEWQVNIIHLHRNMLTMHMYYFAWLYILSAKNGK